LIAACQSPSSDTTEGRPEAELGAQQAQVDGARAGQIALGEMRKESPLGFKVQKIERDSAGYLVTIFPEPLVPGGGGLVRVRLNGTAAIVMRYQ